jgi:hypothetical protein
MLQKNKPSHCCHTNGSALVLTFLLALSKTSRQNGHKYVRTWTVVIETSEIRTYLDLRTKLVVMISYLKKNEIRFVPYSNQEQRLNHYKHGAGQSDTHGSKSNAPVRLTNPTYSVRFELLTALLLNALV